MIKKSRFVDVERLEDKLSDLVRYAGELEEDLPNLTVFKKERIQRRGVEKTIELIADIDNCVDFVTLHAII